MRIMTPLLIQTKVYTDIVDNVTYLVSKLILFLLDVRVIFTMCLGAVEMAEKVQGTYYQAGLHRFNLLGSKW